jgi:hypothetical protein
MVTRLFRRARYLLMNNGWVRQDEFRSRPLPRTRDMVFGYTFLTLINVVIVLISLNEIVFGGFNRDPPAFLVAILLLIGVALWSCVMLFSLLSTIKRKRIAKLHQSEDN